MTCQSEWKDLLGDYVKGTLPKDKVLSLEEHLKECPDCRSDVDQIRLLRKGFSCLAEEHIPVDSLLEYHHYGKESPVSGGPVEWSSERIEIHLSLCEQCQLELKTLSAVREELESEEKTYIEKPALRRRKFFPFRKFWYAVPAAAALILLVLFNLPLRSQGPMLAVIPFEYSGPAEKEFFAESLNDEIIKALEKVTVVGVISLTSTLPYKNTTKKPAQIGQELGVDYLLTGRMRWDTAGKVGKLRVIPKLIRTDSETEVWTENFEIIWGEICNLPGMITRKVFSALKVTLLEPEHRAMETCPTGNIEAYEYYLRGNLLFNQRGPAYAAVLQPAIQMYQKAIELDSNFALAYVMISRAKTEIFWHDWRFIGQIHLKHEAKQAVADAFRLRPDLPEAHLALGSYYYHAGEFDSAAFHLSITQKTLPNSSELWEEMAYMQRRWGKWEEALVSFKKSLELDPRDTSTILELAKTYQSMRNFSAAEKYYDKCISLAPGWESPKDEKVGLYVNWTGDIRKARKVWREVHDTLPNSWFDRLEGNYQTILNELTKPGDTTSDDFYSYLFYKAEIYGLMNQPELMRAYYDSARIFLEKTASKRQDEPAFHSALGMTYAGVGRKEDAIREGKKAVELLPVSKHAVLGPGPVQSLAQIYMMVGEYDKAIDQLEYLLSIPGNLSVQLLRLDPAWAPLRSHLRFQKLINERA